MKTTKQKIWNTIMEVKHGDGEPTPLDKNDLKQYQKALARSIRDWEYELETNQEYAGSDLAPSQAKYAKKLVASTQDTLKLLKRIDISSAKTYEDVAREFDKLDEAGVREMALPTALHNKLVRLGGWDQ